jgi:protein TonB
MVNNNIPRISALEFATSFGMDNSLIKKSYLYSILLITLSFFIAFPGAKIHTGTGGDPPPPPPPFPRPQPPVLPNHHTIFVNVHAPVIPDPTPFEPEVVSGYIYDDPDAERDAMFEGDWLFQPVERPGIGAVRVAKPVCYEKALPFYPELARKAGINGVVIVRIIIGVDGSITNAFVESSPGRQFGFDDAALNAVRQWKCEPAMINDRKVETESVVTVNFRMER